MNSTPTEAIEYKSQEQSSPTNAPDIISRVQALMAAIPAYRKAEDKKWVSVLPILVSFDGLVSAASEFRTSPHGLDHVAFAALLARAEKYAFACDPIADRLRFNSERMTKGLVESDAELRADGFNDLKSTAIAGASVIEENLRNLAILLTPGPNTHLLSPPIKAQLIHQRMVGIVALEIARIVNTGAPSILISPVSSGETDITTLMILLEFVGRLSP